MVLFIVADDAHQSPVRAIDAQHVSIGEVRPGKGHRPPLKEKSHCLVEQLAALYR